MSLAVLSELFDQALEYRDPEARERFIAERCAGAPSRARELRDMVAAHCAEQRLLDSPTQFLAAASSAVAHADDRPAEGSSIGPYKLLEQIGEGGMGIVFMAEQQHPIRRRVALKIIKGSQSTQQVLVRFEAEREALSRLDHPNITRILDAGQTEEGLPYFVMELVRGMSITEYCDKQPASVEDRLELLEQACRAVHHAHQKGIIHRDLKPSNVMVTMHDGRPVPKIIDFGIAKALDQPLTEKTLFTRYGDMIGTPQYMSPEQAEMSGLDVDAHSDIYSLGVIMYELLTGSTPVESDAIKSMGLLGIFQTIRDCEPEPPSVRVTRTLSQDEQIAGRRRTTGKSLRRSIAGEIDWITLKALAKKKSERYESAAAMARDLRAYLDGEAVDAAAPSLRYQAQKLFRRHKALCVTTLVAAATLIALTTVSAYWALANAELNSTLKKQSAALERANRRLSEQRVKLEHTNQELRDAAHRAASAEARATLFADQERRNSLIERVVHDHVVGDVLPKAQPSDEAASAQTAASPSGPTSPLSPAAAKLIKQARAIAAGQAPTTPPADVATLPPGESSQVSAGAQGLSSDSVDFRLDLMLQRIQQALRMEFGDNHVLVADHMLFYSRYLLSLGDGASALEAENRIRNALDIYNTNHRAFNSVEMVEAHTLLAKALLMQNRTHQAVELYGKIVAVLPRMTSVSAIPEKDAGRAEATRLIVEELRAELDAKGLLKAED